jgi:hypothetical protein
VVFVLAAWQRPAQVCRVLTEVHEGACWVSDVALTPGLMLMQLPTISWYV